MELKVVCNCGQKYKFDVEPVNRQMPYAVNCPVCGVDGTPLANNLLMQLPSSPPPLPVAAAAAPVTAPAAGGGLRINHAAPSAPPPVSVAAPARAAAPARPATTGHTPAPAVPKYMRDNPALQNNNFLLGAVGAFLGAIVGAAFLVGAQKFFGFTLSYFAVVVGAMIGFGARLMYRGTSSTLGALCGVLALFTIAGTLYYMDGMIGLAFDILYLVVGSLVAFKVAS